MLWFYILIIFTGILTTITDITEHKIKNKHLLFISLVGIFLYIILFIKKELKFSLNMLLNPFVSLIIGFILYKNNLWRAGDGKLFFIYSLLLPLNKYSSILPFSCFTLFLNTFLIAFLFILPSVIKNFLKNKEIFKKLISKKTFLYFGRIFLITFCLSWMIRPLLYKLHLEKNIFFNFILLYTGYSFIRSSFKKIKNKFISFYIILIALILRYLLFPESLSITSIINYLKYLFSYSLIIYLLKDKSILDKTFQKRVPFAPFMFIGALLTNTDFLKWVLKTLAYLKRLI